MTDSIQKALTAYDHAALGAVYSALADGTRRHIVSRLTQQDLNLREMGVGLDISKQAISKHVRILEDAGLINRSVRGREHVCSLRREGLGDAQRWIEDCRQAWSDNLSNLNAHLARKFVEDPDG